MRGRKPTPTMLANLHGRPRKNKPPPMEPKPVGDLDEGPDWLSEEQRAGWRHALAHSPPGLLKRLDRGVLAVWVVAEDLHRQAVKALNVTGLLVKSKNSDIPSQSPYLAIANRQGGIMLKAASELGFTPVSRPRVFANGPAPGEALHGQNTSREAGSTLADFLATDPDAPTIN